MKEEDKEWSCFTYKKELGFRKYNNTLNLYSEDENNTNFEFFYTDLTFSIQTCEEYYSNYSEEKKANNITCPQKADYAKIDKPLTIEYMISNNIITPKNFDNPVKTFRQAFSSITIDYKFETTRTIFYQVSELRDDDGFLFENLKSRHFLEYDYYDDFLNTKPYSFYFGINFRLSKKYIIYYRTYLKIQGLLAIVGGFMNVISIFFQFLYSFYIQNNYTISMIKRLFNVELKESPNEEVHNSNKIELVNLENNDNNRNNLNVIHDNYSSNAINNNKPSIFFLGKKESKYII